MLPVVLLVYMGFFDSLLQLIRPQVISPIPDQPDYQVRFTTPTPTPTPSPRPTPVPNPYEKATMETFDKWNVPREVAFGIRKAEGGRRNGFNIGAVDSNPGRARTFDNILAEATTAAKMLSGNANPEFYGNGEVGRQAFAEANQLDPVKQIIAIMNAGYAGNPRTWQQRSAATGGAGLMYPTWADFVQDTPDWRKWHGNY